MPQPTPKTHSIRKKRAQRTLCGLAARGLLRSTDAREVTCCACSKELDAIRAERPRPGAGPYALPWDGRTHYNVLGLLTLVFFVSAMARLPSGGTVIAIACGSRIWRMVWR